MLKVGLTGGYATGKSFVAGELERLGCLVIYADRLGHATLAPGGEAYGPALDLFGPEILDEAGTIDRKKLGARVFASPDLLEKLNSFVHPAVYRLEQEAIDAWRTQHPEGIAVVEAAILIETGRYHVFDRLIVTSCPVETQIARGIERDGLTRDGVLARLSRQMPSKQKAEFSDFLIDTNGTKESTLRQVELMWQQLQRLAEAGGR